ncbi:MAG: MATE family efflux transporter [Tissierellia bacterium]|nr:MATE family efflux transporter [Tissierellia bacterium]
MSPKKRGARSELMLNGPLYKVIWILSAPLIINNFIMTFYNIADGLYVAQLSSTAFAATSFVWPVLYLFISIGFGLSIAGTSILSQLLGGKHFDWADRYGSQLVMISTALGIVFCVIGYGISPFVVRWMGATGEFYHLSNLYLRINFIGITFDMVFFACQSILNAQGNTKTPTIISVMTSILNIILDPFLIFGGFTLLNFHFPGLDMGIGGAAIATILSKLLAMILGLFALFFRSEDIKIRLCHFTPQKEIIRHIFKTGIPTSIGQSGAAFGFIVLNGFVQSYGTDTLAAYAMVNRVTQLMTQPAMGFGGALTSIVGQNFGAKQLSRAKKAFQKTSYIVIGASFIGSLLIFFFREPLLHLFIKEKDNLLLIQQATEYMNYSIFIIFFMGMFSVYQGLFQGLGYMKYSMYMSLLRLWLVRIPLIVLFKNFTDLGATGIWISMLVSNVFVIAYAHWLYERPNFKIHQYQ